MSKPDDIERSKSGAPIYRHPERQRELERVYGDSESIERISDHIEKYIGVPSVVLHEKISDLVHVDVHVVPPGGERDFYTLITSGMSDRPMKAPPQFVALRFAEIMVCLPPHWPLSSEAFKDEAN
jgi:hypothetical protein